MDQNSDVLDTLRRKHAELVALRLPRLGSLGVQLQDDFDVDLYYDDEELQGLAEAVLEHRPLPQPAIVLDPTIDERITAAAARLPNDPTIEAFQQYRDLVLRVAELLSQAAEIPIERRVVPGWYPMSVADTLLFLEAHQPMPPDHEVTHDLLQRYQGAIETLEQQPDDRAVLPLLNSFGDGDAFGAYQRASDVLHVYDREIVIASLQQALESPVPSVRAWCARIARTYQDPRLAPK